jgi:hypothetical protein
VRKIRDLAARERRVPEDAALQRREEKAAGFPLRERPHQVGATPEANKQREKQKSRKSRSLGSLGMTIEVHCCSARWFEAAFVAIRVVAY